MWCFCRNSFLQVKMNMKRKIPLKRVVRQKGSPSNAPPLIVTFEEQVRFIKAPEHWFLNFFSSSQEIKWPHPSFQNQGDRDEVLRLSGVMKHSGFAITESGVSFLNVMTNGGHGDVDIYLKRDDYPT